MDGWCANNTCAEKCGWVFRLGKEAVTTETLAFEKRQQNTTGSCVSSTWYDFSLHLLLRGHQREPTARWELGIMLAIFLIPFIQGSEKRFGKNLMSTLLFLLYRQRDESKTNWCSWGSRADHYEGQSRALHFNALIGNNNLEIYFLTSEKKISLCFLDNLSLTRK